MLNVSLMIINTARSHLVHLQRQQLAGLSRLSIYITYLFDIHTRWNPTNVGIWNRPCDICQHASRICGICLPW